MNLRNTFTIFVIIELIIFGFSHAFNFHIKIIDNILMILFCLGLFVIIPILLLLNKPSRFTREKKE